MRNIETIESVKGLIRGRPIEVKLTGRILMHPREVRHHVFEIALPRVRKIDNFAGADLVACYRSRLIDGRRRARHVDRFSNLLFMLQADLKVFGLSYLHPLQFKAIKPLLLHTYLIKAWRNAGH